MNFTGHSYSIELYRLKDLVELETYLANIKSQFERLSWFKLLWLLWSATSRKSSSVSRGIDWAVAWASPRRHLCSRL